MNCVVDWEEDMDLELEWDKNVVDTKFGINDFTVTHLAAKNDSVEIIFNKYNLVRYD